MTVTILQRKGTLTENETHQSLRGEKYVLYYASKYHNNYVMFVSV